MKALKLATKLENGVSAQLYYDRRVLDFELAAGDAASELRRLAEVETMTASLAHAYESSNHRIAELLLQKQKISEVNAELLEALENVLSAHPNDFAVRARARTVIAKAKEQQ